MVLASASNAPTQKAASSGGRSLLPLVLGVKRKSWRGSDERMEADPAFKDAKQNVLRRDDHRCRFCGLNLPKHLEAHHLNDDHSSHALENLVTACAWCHGCHHIGSRGAHQLAVLAIHPEWPHKNLPEQWQLHHLIRSILIVPQSQMEPAQEMVNFLYGECTNAVANWLPTADPVWLGERLLELDDAQYKDRARYLKGIRLLPQLGPPEGDLDQGMQKEWTKENAIRDYWKKEALNRVGADWSHHQEQK
jgi:intracellular multiplication protein IcmJ